MTDAITVRSRDALGTLADGLRDFPPTELAPSPGSITPTLSEPGALPGSAEQGPGRDFGSADVIPPYDGRQRVPDSSQAPFPAVAFLQIRYRDGTKSRGTAFFIGRRGLATAGHNLHSPIHGPAQRIDIVPGYDGYTSSADVCVPIRTWLPSNYPASAGPANDVGLLFVEAPVGDTVGWFGVSHYAGGFPPGLTAAICGYPFDKPVGQYVDMGGVAATAHELRYVIDTEDGMSGSPVYILYDGTYRAIGVHNTGSPSVNIARRFSPPIYQIMVNASQA
jgi:glutamyl endopeptidase